MLESLPLFDGHAEGEHGGAGFFVDALSLRGDREAVGTAVARSRLISPRVLVDRLTVPCWARWLISELRSVP